MDPVTLAIAKKYADTAVANAVIEAGSGDVVGPASVTADRIAVFNGTTGKLLKQADVAVAGLATAAQGSKADSAVQPAAIANFVSGDGITDIVACTQAEYDGLTPDASTLYVITDA